MPHVLPPFANEESSFYRFLCKERKTVRNIDGKKQI